MLSKILQVLGIMFSVAGLLGDERIQQWDRLLRIRVTRLLNIKILDKQKLETFDEESFGGSWHKYYSNVFRKSLSDLFHVFGDKFAEHIYFITGAFLSAILWSIPLFKIKLTAQQTIFGIIFSLLIWLLAPQVYVKWRIVRLGGKPLHLSFTKSILLWVKSIPENLANLLFSFVIALQIPLFIIVFILSPLILTFSIVFVVVLIMTLQLFLLPYFLLDSIAGKFRMKSTVLLLGLVIELLGVVFQ